MRVQARQPSGMVRSYFHRTPPIPVTLPSRPFAYLCLALSMTLVGSYVALSKPLAAVLPVFLLAWMRFGIGTVAMRHWLRKPAGEPPAHGADQTAAVSGVVPGQLPVHRLHDLRREPDERRVGRRDPGRHSGGGGGDGLDLSARTGGAAHLGRRGLRRGGYCAVFTLKTRALRACCTGAGCQKHSNTVLLPVSAALVGVLVLGESLTGLQLLAFAIAIASASVIMATLPSRAALRMGQGG